MTATRTWVYFGVGSFTTDFRIDSPDHLTVRTPMPSAPTPTDRYTFQR